MPRLPPRRVLGRALASLAVTASVGLLPGAVPLSGSAAALSPVTTAPSWPVGAVTGAAAPAGAEGVAAGSAASYRLYHNPDGSPVRFDPCRPVRVRVNAPTADAEADAREALRRLAAVTGLDLVVGAPTDFVPTRAARTLPGVEIVIAWAAPAGSPGGSDILADGQLGTGGWSTEGRPSGDGVVWRATGGFAVLDVTRDAELSPGFGPGLSRGALLLHEVAHALGVDHSDDATQLMAPTLQVRREAVALGAGDLAALRRVGVEAGCLPV